MRELSSTFDLSNIKGKKEYEKKKKRNVLAFWHISNSFVNTQNDMDEIVKYCIDFRYAQQLLLIDSYIYIVPSTKFILEIKYI